MLLCAFSESWYWLLTSIVIVWRLTNLICFESGPFNMFDRCRALLYKWHLGKVIECFHCASLWMSTIIGLLIFQTSIQLPFLILAIAGGASIIENFLNNIIHHDQSN